LCKVLWTAWIFFIIGCSPDLWPALTVGFLEGISEALLEEISKRSDVNTNLKLMLFGGENHQTYLGCLTCGRYSTESIFNEYGPYGSKYSSTSIWNKYGLFGSPYSQYSPWNPYASDPPVIVDDQGNFYGRFTVNRFHPQRTTIPEIRRFLDLVSEQIR